MNMVQPFAMTSEFFQTRTFEGSPTAPMTQLEEKGCQATPHQLARIAKGFKPTKYLARLLKNILELVEADKVGVILPANLEAECSAEDRKRHVLMALLSDSLVAISTVYPHHSKFPITNLARFIALAQKPFILSNKDYFEDRSSSATVFLHAHTNDAGLYGGRHTGSRWSGLKVVEAMCEELGSALPLQNYKKMIYACIRSLLPKDQIRGLVEATELKTLYASLSEIEGRFRSNLSVDCIRNEAIEASASCSQVEKTISVEFVSSTCQLALVRKSITGAAFFDVRHNLDASTELQLNTAHPIYSQHSTEDVRFSERMLEAWAMMEQEALGNRKQLLEDIRHDWGRYLRDLVQRASAEREE